MKIIIFGNGNAGINVVQGILYGAKRRDVSIIYVYKYGYTIESQNILNIRFDEKIKDELATVKSKDFDIVMAAGWHRKFLDELVNAYDCFNVHPSILPKYRGILPLEFQLLNKEKKSGITIHKMNNKYDAGPIYAQEIFSIEKVDTVAQFVVAASRVTRRLCAYFVDNYSFLEGRVQDEEQATYYSEKDRHLLMRGAWLMNSIL